MYRDELLLVLSYPDTRCSAPDAGSSALEGRHYQRIYQFRAKRLREKRGGEAYWQELADASERLCLELEEQLTETISLWVVERAPYEYIVFEAPEAEKLLACLKFDRRQTSNRELA